MYKLDHIELPSKHLTCYESVLMTLLKAQGIHEESAFMGTQATFLFSPDAFSISAKVSSVDDNWKRLYGFEINSVSILDEADLQQKLIALLAEGTPVCVPVDLFVLPHTLHHQQLHQHHYVNLFAYENGRFYMVCPYYRYQGWVDAQLIVTGFFSDVVRARATQLITIPPCTRPEIDEEQVNEIIEDNCQTMLNLSSPDSFDPQYVGLVGITTFTNQLQQLAEQEIMHHKDIYVNLSRHATSIGNSRYWLHQLIQNYHPNILSSELGQQFANSTQAWKAVGMQLGMVAHGQRPDIMQRVFSSLQTIQQQETRLFNSLLGVLPTYEQGIL